MRYIIGLLLGIGLVVLTFILIFKAFSGHNAPKAKVIDLNDYANTAVVVRYTIDGAIVSNQKYNRIRITVSKDQVLYEQINGYEGNLVNTKTYPSNINAYANFLRALQIAGFTKGDPKAEDDYRGYCPFGQRYIYEGLNGGDTLIKWWSSSCGTSVGNFRGNANSVRRLFQNQVPDYTKLTSNVRL